MTPGSESLSLGKQQTNGDGESSSPFPTLSSGPRLPNPPGMLGTPGPEGLGATVGTWPGVPSATASSSRYCGPRCAQAGPKSCPGCHGEGCKGIRVSSEITKKSTFGLISALRNRCPPPVPFPAHPGVPARGGTLQPGACRPILVALAGHWWDTGGALGAQEGRRASGRQGAQQQHRLHPEVPPRPLLWKRGAAWPGLALREEAAGGPEPGARCPEPSRRTPCCQGRRCGVRGLPQFPLELF